MKPAIQGEFFIKIGVVCLGATILFSDVMKSGVFGLVQACLVVAVVWFFAFRFSRRMKVDERSAMILRSPRRAWSAATTGNFRISFRWC